MLAVLVSVVVAQPLLPNNLGSAHLTAESTFDEVAAALSQHIEVHVHGRGVGSSTALLTVCHAETTSWEGMCNASISNMATYASRHGYTFLLVSTLPEGEERTGPAGAWWKIPMAHAALAKGYHQILMKDSDALIMNHDLPLNSLFSTPDHQLAIAYDQVCLANTGHFLLKAGSFADSFLRAVWNTYPAPAPDADSLAEQGATVFVLAGERTECRNDSRLYSEPYSPCNQLATKYASTVAVHKQQRLNSYLCCPAQEGDNTWPGGRSQYEVGDFILHFARPGINALEERLGRQVDRADLMPAYAEAFATGGKPAVAVLHASILSGSSSLIGQPCETRQYIGCVPS